MFEKYLLSILIPSRNNSLDLKNTIENIIETSNPDNINYEIIIKIDLDDAELINQITKYKNYTNIKFLVSHQLDGYLSIKDFHNQLINSAEGKYVLLYGSDAEIHLQNWNDYLEKELTEFKIYYPHITWWYKETKTPVLENEIQELKIDFSIFPKKTKEIFQENISPNHLVDMWLSNIFNTTENWYNTSLTKRLPEFRIKHLRPKKFVDLGSANTPQPIWDDYDLLVNSAQYYHNINLLYEHKKSQEYNSIKQHNIINQYRNENNI